MKRAILVGIAAVAMVVAGLAGCSSDKSNTTASTEKVTIDGQNQNITGQVSCTQAGGNVNIGIGDPTNGIGAVISTANPPAVQSVEIGRAHV